jgi:phage portal protein BeeE
VRGCTSCASATPSSASSSPNRALWRLAVLPLATHLLDGLADGLKGWFDGARIAVDLDGVPALSEDRERLWGIASGADFLSREEKRAMVGYDR